MLVLISTIGLVVGALIDWLADYAPRLASSVESSTLEDWRWPNLNLWQLVTGEAPGLHPAWQGALLELVWATLASTLWIRFGLSWRFTAAALASAFLTLIAVTDTRYRIIPNGLIYPALALTLLLPLIRPNRSLVLTLAGGAMGLIPFLGVALVKPGGMGGGDIKLATLIGLMVGFPQVVWALSLAILAGALTAGALLLNDRWTLRSHIPYAPFLCCGAITTLLYPLSLELPLR